MTLSLGTASLMGPRTENRARSSSTVVESGSPKMTTLREGFSSVLSMTGLDLKGGRRWIDVDDSTQLSSRARHEHRADRKPRGAENAGGRRRKRELGTQEEKEEVQDQGEDEEPRSA